MNSNFDMIGPLFTVSHVATTERPKLVVSILIGLFLILAGNEDIQELRKILDDVEFRPDPTNDNGVSCPEFKKNPIDL